MKIGENGCCDSHNSFGNFFFQETTYSHIAYWIPNNLFTATASMTTLAVARPTRNSTVTGPRTGRPFWPSWPFAILMSTVQLRNTLKKQIAPQSAKFLAGHLKSTYHWQQRCSSKWRQVFSNQLFDKKFGLSQMTLKWFLKKKNDIRAFRQKLILKDVPICFKYMKVFYLN